MNDKRVSKGFATVWAVVIAIILTAVVVGGVGAGIYFYQASRAEKTKEKALKETRRKLESKIQMLKNEIAELKKAKPKGEEDKYAGWSTFTDEELDYSIRYPATWYTNPKLKGYPGSPIEAPGIKILFAAATHPQVPSFWDATLPENDQVRFSITYYEEEEGKSLEEWLKESPPKEAGTWITLNGTRAYRITTSSTTTWPQRPGKTDKQGDVETIIKSSKGGILVLYGKILYEFDDYAPIATKIEDSFRITK